MTEPLVSLVITTKNEEKNVDTVMRSIKAQSYKNIETILVDNGSSDRTKEIAKKYTNKVFDKGPERSAQRNFGMIDQARGEYVMFIDCDMILSPQLIENCVKFIKKDAIALHIPEVVLGKNYWSRVRRFERSFYNGTVIDGARFFKRDKFVEAGGFDETMSGPEDWDIDKKIKQIGKIRLLEARENVPDWVLAKFILDRGVNHQKYGSVVFHNESEFDLKKYFNKKGYYAQSFDGYIQKWGKNDPDIRKQFGIKYRYFQVFIENSKWKKLFKNIDLAAGMFYLRFVIGVKFILRKR
jgi:glycosyltransferase involved in cell wall biosynthesis